MTNNSSQGGRQFQAGEAMQQAERVVNQLGIDINAGLVALVVAVVSGIVTAILDRLFKFPTGTFMFAFGVGAGMIAVINGPVYAMLKGGKDSLASVIMAVVSGFVALLLWWITTKIIGDYKTGPYSYNYADRYGFFKILLSGILGGLIGYGWYALVRRLPTRLSR